jgi:hypothetical protein
VFVLAELSSLAKFLWIRSGAYPRVVHHKGITLGIVLANSANIRLSWKGLIGTNTLAYSKVRKLRTKKVYNIGPGLKILSREKHASLFDRRVGEEEKSFFNVIVATTERISAILFFLSKGLIL